MSKNESKEIKLYSKGGPGYNKGYELNGKWIFLCPFHAEKTPSCSMDNPWESSIVKWHCFGCGKSGLAYMIGGGGNDGPNPKKRSEYIEIRLGLDFDIP